MDAAKQSESVLFRIHDRMAGLEKRDVELWVMVAGAGLLASVGLLALALPAALRHGNDLVINLRISPQLFLGAVAVLLMLNFYFINRRSVLRRTREQLISTTIQSELTRWQSFIDPLTEVYNRRSFTDLINRYISHARRLKKPLSFLMVDVDGFKEVNTRFGHLTGDFVLAQVASILKSSVRGCDAVGRYGGDEFFMVLADSSAAGAQVVVQRIERLWEDWNRQGHLEGHAVGLSLGIAEWSEGKTLEALLEEADQNMYRMKAARQPGTSPGIGDGSLLQ